MNFTFLSLSFNNSKNKLSRVPYQISGGHADEISGIYLIQDILTESSMSFESVDNKGKTSLMKLWFEMILQILIKFTATYCLTSGYASIAKDLISLTMNTSVSY